MRVSTINVIELVNESISQVCSFSDDDSGNKAAEKLFGKFAKENGFTRSDVKIGLEDGYLTREDYTVFLVHSTNEGL
jgi:hypothetical protein